MSQAVPTTEAVPANEVAPAPAAQPAVESDADFFAKAGPLPTAWDEARRFPRFYYRAKVKATVHPFRGARSRRWNAPCSPAICPGAA